VQESKAYLEKALEKDPDFAMAHLFLSFAQPTARQFFEEVNKAKALADKVSEGERLWILGFQAGVDGLPMEQRNYYQKLVELFPNDERAHNLLGLNYFGQQEYQASITEFQKSIAIAPDFSQPYNQMGYAYRFLNQYSEAEKAFQKYIELIPNDPNPYDSYAELLLKMGRYQESIDNYHKALEQNPNFVNSYLGIATDYNLLGEYVKARETLEKQQQIARNNGEKLAGLFALAVSYIDEGNFARAMEVQNQQLAINQKDNDPAGISGTLIATGNILLEMDKPEDAMKKFNDASNTVLQSGLSEDIKKASVRTHIYNSARVLLKKKDIKSAKVQANEFLIAVQGINDAVQIKLAHELLGSIALAEKNYDGAIEELGQANQLNPYNFYRLALAYSGKGDSGKAKECLEKAVNFNSLNDINLAFCRNRAKRMLEMGT
jgi:tetratricopeptide (TPR) repeat protein